MGLTFLIYLALFAVVLTVLALIAKCFYEAAEEKGFPEKKYFWICLLLPPVGYLLVIALPDRRS